MGSSSQPSTSTLSAMADLSEPIFEDTSSVPEQEDVLQETKSQRKKRLAKHKKDIVKKERDKKNPTGHNEKISSKGEKESEKVN